MNTVVPVDTIERFAEISARLDDAFAHPTVVLGAAGLDEVAWKRTEEHWIGLLRGGADGDLVQRFAKAYAETRRARWPSARGDAALAADPRFLGAYAQPWRAEAAAVPLSAAADALLCLPTLTDEDTAPGAPPSMAPPDVDRTLEVPIFQPGPATPFGPGPAPSISAPVAPRPLATILPPPLFTTEAGAPDPVDMTLDIPIPRVERSALPFTSASAPPGKRLARFDPQTGLPLPVPIWVDVPSSLLPKP